MACNVNDDVIEQILLLLPVKSLLRFKSVSVHFRDLITSPTFAKAHFSSVTQGHLFKRSGLYTARTNLWYVSIPCNDSDELYDIIDVVKIYNPVTNPIRSMFGSCNGLLLIATELQVFFLNPCTRERLIFFRDDHISNILKGDYGNILVGLCYDSVVDDYMVAYAKYGYKASVAYIFSCRVGSWKRVACDHFPSTFQKTGQGATLNGCPHWIISFNNPSIVDDYGHRYNTNTRLVFFDTVNEKFKSLSTPNEWLHASPSLSLLGGCLSATTATYYGSSYREFYGIWVMNEFGVEDSWTKLFVIARPHIKTPRTFGYVNNGEEVALVDGDGNAMMYNLKTKEERNYRRRGSMGPNYMYGHESYSVEYAESLVSLRQFEKSGTLILVGSSFTCSTK